MEIWNRALATMKKSPSFQTMFHLIMSYGNDTAAEITDQNGQIVSRSYREYENMSFSACGYLQGKGLYKKNDVVGLCYDTCMDWPVLFWGVLMSGGIPLLLNPAAEDELLCRIMKEAGATAYVSYREMKGCELPFIKASHALRPGNPGNEDWADQIALCTSGTTGMSRIFLYDGAAITGQMIAFDDVADRNRDLPFREGEPCKTLGFLPFHHIFGFIVVYCLYAVTGKTVVYLRDKGVQTITEACRRHGVTHLCCVPMFFNALAGGVRRKLIGEMGMSEEQLSQLMMGSLQLQAAHAGEENVVVPDMIKKIQYTLLGPQIRLMITGGGHIPDGTLKLINALGYPLYNGFGMTETGVCAVEVSYNPLQRIKGSIGRPFKLVDYMVSGEGDSGELLVNGAPLHSGTIVDGIRLPRDKSKWFATGDIVRKTTEGLYIIGRSKDVIINASGENIYPDELEDYFIALPGTVRNCVMGLKNGDYEDIALIVEAIPGSLDKDALVDAFLKVNDRLPADQKVSRFFVTEAPLPLSASMKVRRRALKAGLEDGTWKAEELHVYNKKDTAVPAAAASAAVDAAELAAIRDTVRRIFAEKLNVDENTVGDGDNFVMELGADSLALYSAFCALEDEYNIVITDSDYKELSTLTQAVQLVYAKLHPGVAAPAAVKEAKQAEEEVIPAQHRITDFAKSPEYLALCRRKEETITNEEENPYFKPHDSVIRDTSFIGGKMAINLGSYNYLGMSGHPETAQAAIDAILKYGTSASGSRTLAGEKTIYMELEKAIADWKHTEDSIVCTGGWATNLTFVSTFCREGDLILYDVLSHNSICEGVALSKAESKAFGHNDLEMLEKILQKTEGKYNKVLIIVEGVYSMDGDIAPIPEFVALKKKYGCFLMVDEAHSGGVIGDNAGGVDDYFHLDPHDIDIKMGTLSKALGACGGYIAADHSIVEFMRYSMNGFVFTAGISPALAAEAMKAIEIIRRDNSAVTQLHRNVEYFVRRCREEGMNIGLAGKSAIVPVLIGSDADAARLSAVMLRDYGVFVPPAMYPAVPMGESRLRFTISAPHTIEQLETAVSSLSELMHKEGFLK